MKRSGLVGGWAIAAALALFAPSIAAAQAQTAEDPLFEQMVKDALKNYDEKKFDQAAQGFEAAYKIRQDANLIYNAARCYEQSLKRTEAIEAFQRYVELPGTNAELRATALSKIEALKKEQAALSKPANTALDKPAQDNGARATQGSGGGVEMRRPEGKSHTLEYVLIGGGAAVTAVGVVFTALAFKANSDFDSATTHADKVKFHDDTKRNALIADVTVGLGVVSIGAGVIMLLLDQGDQGMALAPQISGDSTGLAVAGRF